MRSLSPLFLIAGLLVGMTSLALCDNLIKNADFKQGSQGWHGDGKAVFLKPDGTEGDETDSNVIPVLRVTLAKGQPHSVYQEIHSKDAAGKVSISVEVFASPDFKRSTHADDYATNEWLPMPVTDFMIRFMPNFFEHDSNLKPGEWVTVQDSWSATMAAEDRSIFFVVPPGTGFVYLKNPSLLP